MKSFFNLIKNRTQTTHNLLGSGSDNVPLQDILPDDPISHEASNLVNLWSDVPPLQRVEHSEWLQGTPHINHPDRDVLWQANQALAKIRQLRQSQEVKPQFLNYLAVYEQNLHNAWNYLFDTEHTVAFVGAIGVGKTTAICNIAGLVIESESNLGKKSVLQTSSGRTTLCEVHITRAANFGISITPRTRDSIRCDVNDWAAYLMDKVASQPKERVDNATEHSTPQLSDEVRKAIQNMAGLAPKPTEPEPPDVLARSCSSVSELAEKIFQRLQLDHRTLTEVWHEKSSMEDPHHWLKKVFMKINTGQAEHFSLPMLIEVFIPDSTLGTSEYPITLIDTKGIDDNVIVRDDLEQHFDRPRTILVLCSSYNAVPDTGIVALLERAARARGKSVDQKALLLVLPRNQEAANTQADNGDSVDSDEEGYEVKKRQVQLTLRQRLKIEIKQVYFNSGKDDFVEIREHLTNLIQADRAAKRDEISELSTEVSALIDNRENEELRILLLRLSQELIRWLEQNQQLHLANIRVDESLCVDMRKIHAATLNATISRRGCYANLNYYQYLATEVRQYAVTVIATKRKAFHDIAEHYRLENEEEVISSYVRRVLENMDAALERDYVEIQEFARDTLKPVVISDEAYWDRCTERWGQKRAQRGVSYRGEISIMTEEHFCTCYQETKLALCDEIQLRWQLLCNNLIDLMRNPS